MREVPEAMTAAWHSKAKIGSKRPVVRATIQRQHLKKFEYDTAFVQGGTFDHDRHRIGHFASMIFGDNSPYYEIRNIQSCSWERSVDQDTATCTLTILNTDINAIGNERAEGVDGPEGELDKPGYFTYNRGNNDISENRWGFDEETGWNGVFVPDMTVKTYEGYGGDLGAAPALDENLIQSGMWMIDKVTYDTEGLITLEMRDLGRLLTDQIVFPPAIPKAEYPLSWVKNQSVNVPARDCVGGEWKDRLRRFGKATSSNIKYVGAGLTNLPYDKYVGTLGGVEGHSPGHAITTHDRETEEQREVDLNTLWRSTGQDSQNAYVWWQYDVETGRMPVGALRLRMAGGPYRVYVSVHNGTKWLGKKMIGWKKNGITGSPGNVDIDARIPFVTSAIADRFHEFDITLPRKYNAKKIRLTFTHLTDTGAGEHRFRAGLREMKMYTADDLSDLSFEKGEVLKLVGNYGDYCADEETEILTKRGWLSWDQVEIGDETLAINESNGLSEWTVIDSVFREHRTRQMHSIESQSHSSLTTPDHKWLVRDHKNRMIWTTTEGMKTGQSIPVTAGRSDIPTSAKYEDDFVELVAWWWTEGSLDECLGGEISQSPTANPQFVDRIRSLLNRLYGEPGPMRRSARVHPRVVAEAKSLRESGMTWNAVGNALGISGKTVKSWSLRDWEPWALWNETQNKQGLALFNLSKYLVQDILQVVEGPEKVVLPEFLTLLTADQLSLYIETSIDADGWRYSGGRSISQASEARIRSFEMACALAGIGTSVTSSVIVKDDQEFLHWGMTLKRQDFTWPQGAKRELVDYDGMIWCPTLKHHNWLARRHGKVYFTGNTQIVKWVCAWAGWYWPPHETGMDFVRIQPGFDYPPDKDWVTFANPDQTLPKGRVWGDFMKAGTAGTADLTVDMFDKKPLADIINYVRDLLGYNFWIDETGAVVWRMPNIWETTGLGNYLSPARLGDGTPGRAGRHGRTSEIVTIDENETLLDYSTTLDSSNIRERIFVANVVGGVGTVIKGFNPYPIGLQRTAGWCVDTATEIFTRRGWLSWDQVQVGDETLSLDLDGRSVWQSISEVAIFDPEPRTMVSISGNNFGAVTTGDHRWFVERYAAGRKCWERRYVTTNKITRMDRVARAATGAAAPLATISDSTVELVAWIYTEGSLKRANGLRAVIYQSPTANPDNCESIRLALKEEFGDSGWSSKIRKGCEEFTLPAASTRKLVGHLDEDKAPTMEFLLALTQDQLELFIDISIKADGHVRLTSEYATTPSRFFYQSVGPRLDSFLAACALAGVPTSMHVRSGEGNWHGKGDVATVTLLANQYATIGQMKREDVEYEGVIWCPAMPEHHNWLARRGGSVFFTGNTDQNFKTKRETIVMADMISARSMFTYKTAQAVIPGYPAIQIDDQVRIFERVTNETFYHYVLGIKSELNMDDGEWTYSLQTHWLGEDPEDAWMVKVEELKGVTQQYLNAVGYVADGTDDEDDWEDA